MKKKKESPPAIDPAKAKLYEEAGYRLVRSRTHLSASKTWAWYGGLFLLGEWKLTEEIPTAATNGRDCFFNPVWMKNYNDKQLAFVVLHEPTHIALLHVPLYRSLFMQNPAVANICADIEANYLILETERKNSTGLVEMPPDAIYDEELAQNSFVTNFYLILDEIEKRKGEGGGGDGKGEGEEGEESDGQGGSGSGGGKPGQIPRPGGGYFPEAYDQHIVDEENDIFSDPEEAQRIQETIEVSLRAAQKFAGAEGTTGLLRNFQADKPVKENWRDAIEQFMHSYARGSDNNTWRRIARKSMAVSGSLMRPSTLSESIESLVIAPDMSGSTFGPIMDEIMSHMRALIQRTSPNEVHVLYWDTVVTSHETFDRESFDSIMSTTEPKGGGGTSPGCIPLYMEENGIKPEATVVITDGEVWGDWGSEFSWGGAPVLWIVIDNPKVMAPHGVTVHVSMDNLH